MFSFILRYILLIEIKISNKENSIKLYSLLDCLPYLVRVYVPKQSFAVSKS